MRRFTLQTPDGRLSAVDYGGRGSPLVLVHGLAGAASEWRQTASRLIPHHRVIAFDQRGHGLSTRTPGRYSRDAYVGDVVAILAHLGEPAVLVGQSMGGTNAYLAASRRPDLVRALAVVEAGTRPDPEAPASVRSWLDDWPVPFLSLDVAREFFSSIGLSPLWASMLVRSADGYRPRFAADDMVESVETDALVDHSDEWMRIACPTLVVAGERSSWGEEEARQMAAMIPNGSHVVIENAGHDVHLDQPDRFHTALLAFLDRVADDSRPRLSSPRAERPRPDGPAPRR